MKIRRSKAYELAGRRFACVEISIKAGKNGDEMAALQSSGFQKFDEDYLCALRARDADTVGHFVNYFTPLLQVKLRKRRCPPEQIEEVVQETLFRVLKLIGSEIEIRQPDRFGALVNSVCTNVLYESWRAHTRYEALEDLQIDPPDKAAGPDEMLARQEIKRKVRITLDQLPPRDRDLLRAVILEERDKDEVCRELGVTREYLRVLLCRAKQQFQKLYEA